MPTFNEFLRTHYAWFTSATHSSGFEQDVFLNDVALVLAEITQDLPVERWKELTGDAIREVRKKHSREFWDQKKFQSLEYTTAEGKQAEAAGGVQEAIERSEEVQEKAESAKAVLASALLPYINGLTDEKERLALLLLYRDILYEKAILGYDVATRLQQSLPDIRNRRERFAAQERAALLLQQSEDLHADLKAADEIAAQSRLDVTKPREVARLLGIDRARLDTYRRRFEEVARTRVGENPRPTWLLSSPSPFYLGIRAAPSTRRARGGATSRRGR